MFHIGEFISFFPLMLMTNITLRDEAVLKACALALYWGEGAKSLRARVVDIANGDVAIIKIFLRYLREVEKVDESRLRVYLYCFDDQDVSQLMEYWSKELRLPLSQFTRPHVRKNGSERTRKLQYGVAHLRYNDKRLLEKLLGQIGEMKSWVGTEAVNRE